MLLTIIIPTYNMQDYLARCLDSILTEHTKKHLDIIVVDDGSSDNSLNIAERYRNAYPECINVIHKDNGQYGSCINAAIKVAKGKYIKILDADDTFKSETFEKFLATIKNVDADLILSDYTVVNIANGKRENKTFCVKEFQELSNNELFGNKKLCETMQMHAVTYRTEILREIGYQQLEGIYYTDQQWIFSPMASVKSAFYVKLPIYEYYCGREGQSMSKKIYSKYATHELLVLENLVKFSATNDVPAANRYYMELRLKNRCISLFKLILLRANNQNCINLLANIDREIERNDNILYNELDKIAYIRHWRKNGYRPMNLRRLMVEVTRVNIKTIYWNYKKHIKHHFVSPRKK